MKLYQVPSGSKSPVSGLATGCAARNAERSAIMLVDPFLCTRTSEFEVPWSPCEQPAPDIRAPSWSSSAKPTSATPLTRLPIWGLVWLDGSPEATVLLVPFREILEMLAVNPPV